MSLGGKIYSVYRRQIYRRFRWLRGTYRLERALARLASSSLESIPESETEPFHQKGDRFDNVVILDACRYDTYRDQVGSHEHRYSLESNTYGYVKQNFSQRELSNTVYVTGNPHFSPKLFQEITGRLPGKVFHEIYHTYDYAWSDENSTCMPRDIIRDAKSARKLFPQKRMVVHFMQPHYPFVTSSLPKKGMNNNLASSATSVWEDVMHGKISHKEAIKGYQSNLEYVMTFVEELVSELDGSTVITSDHGNFLGENGIYGHPEGFNATVVRKVPWDVRE
jgi:hypothetical protein